MGQIQWATDFTEIDPIPGFPELYRVSEEIVTDPTYRWEGATREPHDHCLFKLTLSGHGWFQSKQQRYRVAAGQGFLCRVCDPDIVYWRDAQDDAPWEFLYLVFLGEQAFTLFQEWVGRRGPMVALATNHSWVQRCRRWRQRDNVSVTAGFGLHLLGELFGALGTSAHQEEAGAVRARHALDLMRHHIFDNWSVDDFAEAVGVTREQLTRDCQHYAGEAPYRMYRRLRIAAAARELVDTNQPIQSIAAQYGWATAAHFSRVFHQVTGTTPSQCRARKVLPLTL